MYDTILRILLEEGLEEVTSFPDIAQKIARALENEYVFINKDTLANDLADVYTSCLSPVFIIRNNNVEQN